MHSTTPPKIPIMGKINTVLLEVFGKAPVWNPYESLMEGGRAADAIRATHTPIASAPTPIPETEDFAKAGAVKKSKWLTAAKQAGALSPEATVDNLSKENFEKLRSAVRGHYLTFGADLVEEFTNKGGNCTMFACATIGYLARHAKELLEDGSTIELFGYSDPTSGHAFAVVNRKPGSNPNTMAEWGADCYLVDPWYARHRTTKPGMNPVKDADADSPYWDSGYSDFIKSSKARVVNARFSYEDLQKPFQKSK